MSRSVIAVYSGTFDPLTLGHEDVVRRAAAMFDSVVIAVARAVHKNTLFNLDQRLQLAQVALADCPNVKVLPFDGLIVDFVKSQGAGVIVRGLRSVTDYDYEIQMAGMNRHLAPQVDTVFLHTSANVQHISSTLVREIHRLGGDVSGLVSPSVLAALKALNSGA
ncbi:MAG: pantetheine-phosphate adenylyltransferase [Limnohabitans sp.]